MPANGGDVVDGRGLEAPGDEQLQADVAERGGRCGRGAGRFVARRPPRDPASVAEGDSSGLGSLTCGTGCPLDCGTHRLVNRSGPTTRRRRWAAVAGEGRVDHGGRAVARGGAATPFTPGRGGRRHHRRRHVRADRRRRLRVGDRRTTSPRRSRRSRPPDRRILASTVDVRDRAALKAAIDGRRSQARPPRHRGRQRRHLHRPRPWDEVTPEIWRDTIDINLTGVWNTVQQSAQHLIDAGGGSIDHHQLGRPASRGLPFLSPYVTSKHALVGLDARLLAGARRVQRARQHDPPGRRGHADGQRRRRWPSVGDWLAAHPKLGGILVSSPLPVEIMQPSDITNGAVSWPPMTPAT